MSLKSKIGLILVLIFVLYGVIDFGIQRFIIFPSFISLEREEAIKNSKRSVEAIQREIHHLDTLCHDWSAWDDTYEFIESQSDEYIEANLVLASFTDNNINIIYFSDTKGRIIWGKIYDLETEKSIQLPEFPKEAFPENHLAISYKLGNTPLSDVNISGVYMTQKGPMLFASRPILNSDNEGPVRGSFIMGRFLDDEIVKTLVDQTQVDFQVLPIRADFKPKPVKNILNRIPGESPYLVESSSNDFVDSYTTFPDIKGDAALLIHSKTPRKISEKGYATMHYAMYSVLGAGLGVLAVVLLLLQRTVLRPITKLTDHTLSVGKTGDLSTRLSFQRRDEIGILANEFDRMLEQLSEARSKLLEQSYYSGIAEMASGILHNARNILTPMVGQISNIRDRIKNAPLDNIKKSVAELEGDGLDPDRERPLNRYLQLGSGQMVELIQETDHQLEKVSYHIAQIEDILAEQDKLSHSERALEPLRLEKILQRASTLIPQELLDTVSIKIESGISELPVVSAEQIPLIQVFTNLMNNAAESILRTGRQAGNILVNGTVDSNGNKEMIHVEIRDDGEGIETDMLTRIFDRDFSNKKSRSSEMGLHWCGNVLSAMNGNLYAESNGVGQGACFHLRIPVHQQ
jgi:sensor domain CHASE-containing protein